MYRSGVARSPRSPRDSPDILAAHVVARPVLGLLADPRPLGGALIAGLVELQDRLALVVQWGS